MPLTGNANIARQNEHIAPGVDLRGEVLITLEMQVRKNLKVQAASLDSSVTFTRFNCSGRW